MPAFRRRQFIRGLGMSLAAAPAMSVLAPFARVEAADGPVKRFVVFFSPNGTIHAHWRPQGEGESYSFAPGSILEPLEDHKSDIIVVSGLDFLTGDNHEGGMANMLTAGGSAGSPSGGKSIDQFIAGRLEGTTRFPSLEFGVQTSAWGGTNQTRMCYASPDTFVTPDDSPSNVYNRMFGDLAGGEDAANQLRARRQRVIDLLVDEANDLKKRVGSAQKAKLDAHLEALSTVENSLYGGADCGLPEAPMDADPMANDNFPVVGKAQMDLLVLGLACDMTRVASLQWSHTVGPVVMSWLGVSEGHHSLSHIDDGNTAGVAEFVKTERWFAEQFAYLLEQLKALPDPEGEGTMLDNTVVLWAQELGDGRQHTCIDVPFIVAGGGNHFNLGRHVMYDHEPHNKLMVSICQAMGLDNDTFGDPAHGSGPLSGLA